MAPGWWPLGQLLAQRCLHSTEVWWILSLPVLLHRAQTAQEIWRVTAKRPQGMQETLSYKALPGFPHPTELRLPLRAVAITLSEQLGPPHAPHTALLSPVQVTHCLGPCFAPCSHQLTHQRLCIRA